LFSKQKSDYMRFRNHQKT